MDWVKCWKKAARDIGLDISRLAPVQMELGYARDAAALAERAPVFWMRRERAEAGLLEIHKQIVITGRLPSDDENMGHEGDVLLKHLARFAGQIECEAGYIGVLTAATLQEWDNDLARQYAPELLFWKEQVRRALQVQGTLWHRRSYCLGPDLFICRQDFEAELGPGRRRKMGTIEQFARVVVRGHRRVFDAFALVRPIYLRGAPSSIQSDLDRWHAEYEAERLCEQKRREAEQLLEQTRQAAAAAAAAHRRRQLLPAGERDRDFPQLCWQSITKETLAAGLEAFPVTHLTVMYGVSETAIRKRMDKWRLEPKSRGYWLRVKAASARRA